MRNLDFIKKVRSSSKVVDAGRQTSIPAYAAGDLFGVIVFIVIAIISVLGKLQETKKKGDWEPPDTSPSVEPEDLPEPIRRMLYGDREQTVRTAKPAHPEQVRQAVEPPVATAAPRAQQAPRQPQQRPVTIAPPPVKPRQQQTTVSVRQVVVRKAAPVPSRPPVQERADEEPRMQPLLSKPAPPKVVKANVPPVEKKPAVPKAVKPPTPERLIKAALASDEAVKPIANPWLFRDKMDLRRAIVLSEILSPPLALRE